MKNEKRKNIFLKLSEDPRVPKKGKSQKLKNLKKNTRHAPQGQWVVDNVGR